MADNFQFSLGSGATGASNDIAGVHYPRVKLTWGLAGSSLDTSTTDPLPVSTALLRTSTASISSGAALSAAVDLVIASLVALQMPAAWTAADLTFQSSSDGATYVDVYSSAGVELQFTAAASRFIYVDPSVFLGMRYIKLRSGTSAAAVNQGAARSITLIGQP